MTALLFIRFGFAIIVDALAFVIWDVGTRPPLKLVRDIGRGVRRVDSFARGTLRFLIGAGLLFLGASVAQPGAPTLRSFMLLETGMLIAALLVENFVGPDLRGVARRR